MDYNRVAKMFGYGKSWALNHPSSASPPSLIFTKPTKKIFFSGTTYSSIEGQLRKAKRIAATLPDDADKEKSEEVFSIDDEEKRVKNEAPGGVPQVRAKKSGRFPSSSSGLKISSEEPVVVEKKGKATGEVKAAGKRVLGGRVTKGSAATGRKKGGGMKVEDDDDDQVLEVVHFDG